MTSLQSSDPNIEAMYIENMRRINAISQASKHGPSDAAMVIAELVKNPNFSMDNQRWLTERITEIQDHEMRVMFFRALEADPDLFYKILLLGSAGVTFLGAMLASGVLPESDAFGSEMKIGGLLLLPAGLTLGVFSAIMLAVPRTFGPDGIKLVVDAGGFGIEGHLEVG